MKYLGLCTVPVLLFAHSFSNAAEIKKISYLNNRHSELFGKIVVDFGEKNVNADSNGAKKLFGEKTIWDDDGFASLAFFLKMHQQAVYIGESFGTNIPVIEPETSHRALVRISEVVLEKIKAYSDKYSSQRVANPYAQPLKDLSKLVSDLKTKSGLDISDIKKFQAFIETLEDHFVYPVSDSYEQFHLKDLGYHVTDWTGDFSTIIQDYAKGMSTQRGHSGISIEMNISIDPSDTSEKKREEGKGDIHHMDALKFAIKHFNSDHSQPLVAGGPEYYFMKSVMTGIAQEFPLFSRFQTYERAAKYKNLQAVLYYGSEKKGSKYKSTLESLKQLTAGCESLVAEKSGGFQTSKSMEYSLNDSKCKNQAMMKELVALGFDKLIVSEVGYDFESGAEMKEARITLMSNSEKLRDMEYVRETMKKSSNTAALAKILEIKDREGEMMIGDAPMRWNLSNSQQGSRPSMKDKFQFQYSFGWGDCMAGCIHRRDWTVEVTPKNFEMKDSDQKTYFQGEVQVISESGSEADGEMLRDLLMRR